MNAQGTRATGVAVLLNLGKESLAVASVGCAHVVLAEVVGSFSQVNVRSRMMTFPRLLCLCFTG